MNEELKEALKLIQNECDKHIECDDCPLSIVCSIDAKPPCSWKLD